MSGVILCKSLTRSGRDFMPGAAKLVQTERSIYLPLAMYLDIPVDGGC